MNTVRNHSKMLVLTSLASCGQFKEVKVSFNVCHGVEQFSAAGIACRGDAMPLLRKQRTRSLQNAGRNNCAATLIRFPSRVNNFLRKYVHA